MTYAYRNRLRPRNERKLQPPQLTVDPVQDHLDPFAHPEAVSRPCPADRPVRVPEAVVVTGQRRDRHHPLDEQLIELHKKSILRHRQNDRLEVIADLIGHEPHLLPLHQFALRIRSPALRLRTLHRNIAQLLRRNRPITRLSLRYNDLCISVL